MEAAIRERLLPAVLWGEEAGGRERICDKLRSLMALPARFGGLGVADPTTSGAENHAVSRKATEVISQAVLEMRRFRTDKHHRQMKAAAAEARGWRDQKNAAESNKHQTDPEWSVMRRRRLHRAANEKINGWLGALPLQQFGQDLSAQELRDALAYRYDLQPTRAPATCDDCGKDWTLEHALDCKKGGLVTHRHDAVDRVYASLAAEVFGDYRVRMKPVIREGAPGRPGLEADIAIWGLWEGQTDAFTDTKVMNLDAKSYFHSPYAVALRQKEDAKKAKEQAACEEIRVHFTPLVSSVDGVLGVEADKFLQRIAALHAKKWKKPYSSVMGWARNRLQFAHVRAMGHCLRGARRSWRANGRPWEEEEKREGGNKNGRVPVADGAALALPMQ